LKKEVKIGFVVLLGLVLLVFGLNFLKGNNLFYKQTEFIAFYDHVDGLTVSNPVTVNGYKVGSVSGVEMDPDGSGNLMVTMSVRETNIRIPKNTEARISSSDLFGSKSIILYLGDDTATAQSGDTLLSTIGLGLQEAVSQRLDPLQKKTEDVILQFNKVLEEFEKILGKSGSLNIEGAFKDIATSIKNIKNTTSQLDTLVQDHGKEIGGIIEDVDGVTNELAQRKRKIGEAIDNFIVFSNEISKADIGGTLASTKKTFDETEQLLADLNSGKGSLGAMMKTDSLHQSLLRSVEELENLLVDIRMNPDRYMHFSVFGSKEKSVSLTRKEEKKLKNILEEKE